MLNRLVACAAPTAFVVLAATLVGVAAVSPWEAVWATLSVVVALLPTAWVAPAGWRRRASELPLIAAALALTMVRDPAMRQMLLPPLLTIAAWAAVWAALDRCPPPRRPLLLAALGLALRAATAPGLGGHGWVAVALALISAAVLPWAACRWGGRWAGLAAAVAATMPLQDRPLLAVAALAGAVVLAVLPPGQRLRRVALANWAPAVGGVALVAAAVAPWGGLGPSQAFTGAGWWSVAALVAALLLAPRLRPTLAGILFVAVAASLGPTLAPPPDRGGFNLTDQWPERTLPAGEGGDYVVDLALAMATDLPQGTPVAVLAVASEELTLCAGEAAVEWAAERPFDPPALAHSRPPVTVRRPVAVDGRRFWRVSGRTVVTVPSGVEPVIRRAPGLSDEVVVVVPTSGPSRITRPRDWPFALFLWATVAVVAVLQLASGCWRDQAALAPWPVLVAGVALLRMPVEPLRLLVERHGVDLCLLALVVAWLPAALRWWRAGRMVLAFAGLLLPLALATPHLTPPLYGDEPFHLVVMGSLAEDHDLDISDDVDPAGNPYQRLFMVDGSLFHSPLLAILLLPGYLVLGRAGALALLAVAAACTAAVTLRRAAALGLPRSRSARLALALGLTYPLATFATQVWPEMIGALAVALGLTAVAAQPSGRWRAALLALLATAVKTRLALVGLPIAAAAWLEGRRRWLGGVVLAAVSAVGLGLGWWFMGHPFGAFRRLHDLLPTDPRQAIRVLGGLLFDPAGGLLFTAPLILVAAAGGSLLWRRGGVGERALAAGGLATVLALLASTEWYGGGSPPARYLVTLLPLAVLAAAMTLTAPRPWRRLAAVALPPSLLSWWVLVSRPHLSINPGDGGYWLADALARRFQAEAHVFFPSFLVARTATVVVPLAVAVLLAGLGLILRARPGLAARLAQATVAVWLVAAAALVLAVHERYDTVIEIEAPQVRRRGGQPVPPPGTFARYSRRNGWLLHSGDEVVVPVHLGAGTSVRLHGQLLGAACDGAALEVRWDDGEMHWQRVRGTAHDGSVLLPPPPAAGRHQLSLKLRVRRGGAAVFDRLVAVPAGGR